MDNINFTRTTYKRSKIAGTRGLPYVQRGRFEYGFLFYANWLLEEQLNISREEFTPAPNEISGNGRAKSSICDRDFDGETVIANSIYCVRHPDTWACHNCNTKGDILFMVKHLEYCRGKLKQDLGGRK